MISSGFMSSIAPGSESFVAAFARNNESLRSQADAKGALQGLLGRLFNCFSIYLFIFAGGAFTDHKKYTYPTTILHFWDSNGRLSRRSRGRGYQSGTRHVNFRTHGFRSLFALADPGDPQTATYLPKPLLRD